VTCIIMDLCWTYLGCVHAGGAHTADSPPRMPLRPTPRPSRSRSPAASGCTSRRHHHDGGASEAIEAREEFPCPPDLETGPSAFAGGWRPHSDRKSCLRAVVPFGQLQPARAPAAGCRADAAAGRGRPISRCRATGDAAPRPPHERMCTVKKDVLWGSEGAVGGWTSVELGARKVLCSHSRCSRPAQRCTKASRGEIGLRVVTYFLSSSAGLFGLAPPKSELLGCVCAWAATHGSSHSSSLPSPPQGRRPFFRAVCKSAKPTHTQSGARAGPHTNQKDGGAEAAPQGATRPPKHS
jgi:hypothetical protein